MPTVLAKRIEKLRKNRGWSQEQLAHVAQISVRTVQRVEAGKPVALETLTALAAVLEVEISILNAPEAKDELPRDVCLMEHISNGTKLVQLIVSGDAWRFVHDDLENPEAARLVGELFDLVRDWGEVASDIRPSQRMNLATQFTDALAAVNTAGVLVFAAQQSVQFGPEPQAQVTLNVTNYAAVRKENPTITRLGEDRFALPVRLTKVSGFTV